MLAGCYVVYFNCWRYIWFSYFIVEKDGTVTNAGVVKSLHADLDKEAVRVVMLMNEMGLKWTPSGRNRSRPVRVQFRIPVRFRLEE
ncbi:MAG: energy transducer TonB [Saprospiraceae bacterium]|nr:energy transducer TonB [Saprospiraceae bacterium]